MIKMTAQEFLQKAFNEAKRASHPFPEYAACEAAEESTHRFDDTNWKLSQLAAEGNNLFGIKQHKLPIYQTLSIPGWEIVNGERQDLTMHWVSYPDWAASFEDRLLILERLSKVYPEYANALKASSGEDFVRQVSVRWSTDPKRADNVLSIYNKFAHLMEINNANGS